MNSLVRSLLPYLNPLNRFYLNFPLVSKDDSVLEKAVFPFRSISNADPFCRLLEAEFLTDAGSVLKPIFVLMQRDRYLFVKDELNILNNLQVDAAWRKAFAYYGKNRAAEIVFFSDQLDQTGQLCSFASLFFCKSRRVFFRPPCHKCGSLLELCTDDELLADFGLQAYSSSLERYLFCPDCIRSENPDFYIFEIDKARSPVLKDRWGLFNDFEHLITDKVPAPEFSCAECPEREICYGGQKKFLARLVPFSFYPFYMFGFEAMPLNGIDYLKLTAGCGFGEIKSELYAREEFGRMAALEALASESGGGVSTFFEPGNFGETFYLKLSFLGEVVEKFLEDKATGDFRPKPVIDNIWVKPAEHGHLSPLLWNFRIDLIDIGLREPDVSWHAPDCQKDSHLLGRIWLYALLFNSGQDLSCVQDLAQKASAQMALSSGTFDHNFAPGLEPFNVFWNPRGKRVEEKWYPLWDRALQIGWRMLNSGRDENGLTKIALLELINTLRLEIKDLLLKSVGSIGSDELSRYEREAALRGILENILKKWRAAQKKEPAFGEEELAETLVLSFKDGVPVSVTSKKKHQPEEEMPETVIISASTGSADDKKSAPVSSMNSKENSSANVKQEKRPEGPEEDVFGDDVMAETIILRPEDIPEEYKKR